MIDQLAEQCYVKTGSSHTDHFAYWKFAELIVKECLNIMENCEGDLNFAIWKTKKDFGVEE